MRERERKSDKNTGMTDKLRERERERERET